MLLCLQEWLRSIVMSMSVCGSVCVSICLSVQEDISRTTCAIFTKSFVHVAHVRGSVLQHVSPIAGKWFSSPLKMHYWPGKGRLECTARAKYAIYECLIYTVNDYNIMQGNCRHQTSRFALCCHCIWRQSQTAWRTLANTAEILTTCFSTAQTSILLMPDTVRPIMTSFISCK